MLRRILNLILFIGCLFLPLQGFSSEQENFGYRIEGEKIYLDSPDQVVMNQKGIFFCVDGDFLRTEAVGHDEKGFFVPVVPMYWICPKGHVNPIYVHPCPKCKSRMPGT